jgi:hypothetical protein
VLRYQPGVEVVPERPAATPGTVGVGLVHGRGDRVAGTLGPQQVRAAQTGQPDADDRDSRMGPQLPDVERQRRRGVRRQRRPGEPPGADQQLTPSRSAAVGGAGRPTGAVGLGRFENRRHGHARAVGMVVRGEQTTGRAHCPSARRPDAARALPWHAEITRIGGLGGGSTS